MSALRKTITLQSDVTEASIFDGAGTEMTICCSEPRGTDAMTGDATGTYICCSDPAGSDALMGDATGAYICCSDPSGSDAMTGEAVDFLSAALTTETKVLGRVALRHAPTLSPAGEQAPPAYF